jgi:hypothetical protein
MDLYWFLATEWVKWVKTLFRFSIFLFCLRYWFFLILRYRSWWIACTYGYLTRGTGAFHTLVTYSIYLSIVYLSWSCWSHPPNGTPCCSRGIESWPLRTGSWGWGDGWHPRFLAHDSEMAQSYNSGDVRHAPCSFRPKQEMPRGPDPPFIQPTASPWILEAVSYQKIAVSPHIYNKPRQTSSDNSATPIIPIYGSEH